MSEAILEVADESSDAINDPYLAKKKERRRSKVLAKRREEIFELNLNSMIDMMTVLLTFMLKQYGAEPVQVNEGKDLRLPFSNTENGVRDMITITISKKWVMVLDQPIVPINEGQIDPSSLQSAESLLIPLLQQKVEEKLQANAAWRKHTNGEDKGDLATLIVDKAAPYKVLLQVMSSVSAAKVQGFKFAALMRDQGAGVTKSQPEP